MIDNEVYIGKIGKLIKGFDWFLIGIILWLVCYLKKII